MVLESWLKSDDPEKVGTAMAMCGNPSGACFSDGECKYGGECFKQATVTEKQMREMKDRMTSLEQKTETILYTVRLIFDRVRKPPLQSGEKE